MSKVDFNDFMQARQNNGTRSFDDNSHYVSYFSLKDDGDEALVRFMFDSPEEIEIASVHRLYVNGSRFPRNVNCRRTQYDPIDNCPICKAYRDTKKVEFKQTHRIFLHLIEYTTENGQVVATPKIWERSWSFLQEIQEKIRTYGAVEGFSNQLFLVKRSGAKGDTSTQYLVNYALPQVYPNEKYPKDESVFAGYSAIDRNVLNLDDEDIMSVLNGETVEKLLPRTDTANTASVPIQPTYEQSYGQTVASQQTVPSQQSYYAAKNNPVGVAPEQPRKTFF